MNAVTTRGVTREIPSAPKRRRGRPAVSESIALRIRNSVILQMHEGCTIPGSARPALSVPLIAAGMRSLTERQIRNVIRQARADRDSLAALLDCGGGDDGN